MGFSPGPSSDYVLNRNEKPNITRGVHPLISIHTTPDQTLILLLIGILFLYAEANRPGTVVLGCAGLLITLLALFRLAHFPLRPIALAEIAAALAIIALSPLIPTVNIAAAAVGIILLAAGLAGLVLTPPINLALAILVAILFGSITHLLLRVALRARRNKRIAISAE